MAELNTNNIYLTIGGVDVHAKITEVKITETSNAIEVTHGAATYTQRQAGLSDTTIDITLAYDVATVSSYIAECVPGLIATIDYGPETNTAGKPRHTQSCLLTKVAGPDITVKKDMSMFALNFVGADAPTNNIYSGATF